MAHFTTPLESLRRWWKRRQMWANRTCWTWRRQSNDPIVRAVRRWKELPSMEKP